MQTVNYEPVKVDVQVEQITVTTDAFYSVCFIAENETAPRTLHVTKLQDLLDNGYYRHSRAYNFVQTVFNQRSMTDVYVRAKRMDETYEEALSADDNTNFYYVVIEDKTPSVVLAFNEYLNASDELKLQFFSSDEVVDVSGRKIVYYYQPSFDGLNILPFYSDGINDYLAFDGGELVLWDDSSQILLEPHDMTFEEASARKPVYPEAAWIGLCGFYFPSRIQWLYKFLAKVETFKPTQIPDLSTTSVLINSVDKATTGSGMTGESVPINVQVSLDWVKYALQQSVWKKLYTEEKISLTQSGLTVLENEIKRVLDLAVSEGMFSEYSITQRSLDRTTYKASFKFTATLVHSILGVDKVEGTVYQ